MHCQVEACLHETVLELVLHVGGQVVMGVPVCIHHVDHVERGLRACTVDIVDRRESSVAGLASGEIR